MRTWKIDGPPEIVEGMVMKVMTSCSLRPAKRARKPPIAWIPSWEFPAIRITASETFETLVPPSGAVVKVALLIGTTISPENTQQNARQAPGHFGSSLSLELLVSNNSGPLIDRHFQR